MYFLQIIGYFLFSCLLMGFIEHQVHSQLMHRPNFLSRRSKKYQHTFEAHALDHHHHYLKVFTDAPVPPGEDKEIRLTVSKAPKKALPFALLIAPFSWEAALIFIGVVTMHHWVWNKIHLEMHKPEGRGFSNWAVYKLICRYHWLHHKYQSKNFNVVFPYWDFLLGTLVMATDDEMREMDKLGFLTKKQQARLAMKPALVEPIPQAQKELVGSGTGRSK
jgi:hypothetical protein